MGDLALLMGWARGSLRHEGRKGGEEGGARVSIWLETEPARGGHLGRRNSQYQGPTGMYLVCSRAPRSPWGWSSVREDRGQRIL